MTDDEPVSESAGVDRRSLIKKGLIVGGAAWAAPVISSRFASPAWAADTSVADSTATGSATVTVPKDRTVDFTVIAGGGGGTAAGGSGGTAFGDPNSTPGSDGSGTAGGGGGGATYGNPTTGRY